MKAGDVMQYSSRTTSVTSMKSQTVKIDQLLIVMLVIYNTFTKLQVFNSLRINVVVWVLYFILTCKHLFHSNRLLLIGILCAACMGGIMFLRGHAENITSGVGSFMHMVFWTYVFSQRTANSGKKHYDKRLLYTILLILMISDCMALNLLYQYPLASRAVAGYESETLISYYLKIGVADFGYVYGSVFIEYLILNLIKNEKQKFTQLLLLTGWIIKALFIIKASYMMAVFALIVLTIYHLILYRNTINRKIFLVLICVAGIILFIPILQILQTIFSSVGLVEMANHVGNLVTSITDRSISNQSRSFMWQRSINGFIANPIFGCGASGGHSFVLDTLSYYGIIGLPFILYRINVFKSWRGKIKGGDIVVIALVYMTIQLFNAYSSYNTMPMLMFIVPWGLACCYQENRGNVNA